jgi:hypothetical protein
VVDANKLTQDAKLARLLAEAANAVTVDNGTCNVDATFFRLEKGQRTGPVIAALAAAGLSAYEARWIGRGVMVTPPGQGQANKRHAANEALYSSLQRAGWPVSPYYQMD